MNRSCSLAALLALGLLTLVSGCHHGGADSTSGATTKKSLYDRLGGIDAIVAVSDDFVDRLAADKRVMSNPLVAKKASEPTFSIPALKFKLATQIAQLTGGPWHYGGKDMRTSHKDLGITEAEWNASVEDLKATLAKFKVPDHEQNELIAIIARTHNDVVTKH